MSMRNAEVPGEAASAGLSGNGAGAVTAALAPEVSTSHEARPTAWPSTPTNGDHPVPQPGPSYGPEASRTLPQRGSLTAGEKFRITVIAVLLVLVGAASGFATSTFIPTEYAARVDILYPLSVEQPTGFLRDDRNLTTQLLLIESRQVFTEIGAAHGLTPEEMDKKISATIVESSEIIRSRRATRRGRPESCSSMPSSRGTWSTRTCSGPAPCGSTWNRSWTRRAGSWTRRPWTRSCSPGRTD
jgi:hypothetical protein